MSNPARPGGAKDRPRAPFDARPDVSVIVVNYNTAHLLDRLLSALDRGSGGLTLQLVVVDNASRDGSADLLRSRHLSVELIENTVNVGFGRANNQALERVRGRHVLLLNTDAFVAADTLPKTVEFMDAHPRCGVLGVRLIGEDGSLQPCCRYFPTPWNTFVASTGLQQLLPGTRLVDDMSWDHGSVRDCDWVPGCYYLVRSEVIARVGLFDPRYFLYYEEVDHCRAVRRAGWSVTYYPYTDVVHIGGESARNEGTLSSAGRQLSVLQIESELLYFRKHHGIVGLAGAVFLGMLADAIGTCKGLLRANGGGRVAAACRHAWRVFAVLVRTRFASRPTR
jgi:N-acetylglucosaminyl-diphospho-decaprenol L-rhamnosyltransferase